MCCEYDTLFHGVRWFDGGGHLVVLYHALLSRTSFSLITQHYLLEFLELLTVLTVVDIAEVLHGHSEICLINLEVMS